ncbi:inositol monophosphatase family protein [Kiloniella laminariae]|uniref:inositol monophosphatase family protein n=1 Tax=Kiloniella laminariae TaxID=454162 RepID=UPI0003799D25|nr:inositol monophosphatase family protein [Kiloniella laminariae]
MTQADNIKHSTELKLAKFLAVKAGDALREHAGEWGGAVALPERDVKVKGDTEAEEIIISGLKASSEFPIFSEESGWAVPSHDKQTPIWIVDPLDGTYNYSRGLPSCCTSIALVQYGVPLLGVINDFNRNEVFWGEVNSGAWLNGTKIQVSMTTDPSVSALMTGFPVKRDFSVEALSRTAIEMGRWKKVRMIGSAALSLAQVACGRADAYHEENIMFWDVAAGLALVSAAGGLTKMGLALADEPRTVWAMNSSLKL